MNVPNHLKMKNDEILHKWIHDELTSEELAVFKLRPEYDALVALYKNTSDWAPPSIAEDAMLKKILEQKKKEEVSVGLTTQSLSILRFWKYAAAAVVFLVGGWFLFATLNQPTSLYQVARGETATGVLPDGSSFLINAESELSFDPTSWKKSRTLKLAGEAFFTVKKGSKFSVITKNGTVEVLGTEFNVNARKKYLEVACQSGRVQVQAANGTIVGTLNKEEHLRINENQTTEKWKGTSMEKPSWINGISKFRKVPLSTVLEEIERQYDIEIILNGVDGSEIISCNFQHEDLALALKTTLGMSDVSFKIEDQKVFLNKLKK